MSHAEAKKIDPETFISGLRKKLILKTGTGTESTSERLMKSELMSPTKVKVEVEEHTEDNDVSYLNDRILKSDVKDETIYEEDKTKFICEKHAESELMLQVPVKNEVFFEEYSETDEDNDVTYVNGVILKSNVKDELIYKESSSELVLKTETEEENELNQEVNFHCLGTNLEVKIEEGEPYAANFVNRREKENRIFSTKKDNPTTSQTENVKVKTRKKTYQCSYCEFETIHRCYMYTHVNSRHTKDKTYQCAYCELITTTLGNLKRHMNAKHIQEYVFKCSYCDYKTFYQENLKAHINTKHTRDKTYQCTYCKFNTTTERHLKRHIIAKHTDEQTFQCDYCTFNTTRAGYLKMHVNRGHGNSLQFKFSS